MKKKGQKKRKLISVISVIGLIACLLALIYPVVSDRWNRYRDSKLIQKYDNAVEKDDKKAEELWQSAQEYNAMLAETERNIVTDAAYTPDAGYEEQLNPSGNGVMGYIEIPSIDVYEPIYHYADHEQLEKGIGHLHGSSLPVGGENTHTLLTGHRGLPNQKFFSDLDKLKKGKKFYIHVLGHTLAYKVDKIQTVLPTEVDSLMIEDGKDLATLVTCTPYGVNTHRLLVTGHRVPFDEKDVKDGKVTTEKHRKVIDPAVVVFIGFVAFIIASIVISMVYRRKRKGDRKAGKPGGPGGAEKPEKPGGLERPGTPGKPGEPDEPKTREKPEEPGAGGE